MSKEVSTNMFIGLVRVSTGRQEESGLGLAARGVQSICTSNNMVVY